MNKSPFSECFVVGFSVMWKDMIDGLYSITVTHKYMYLRADFPQLTKIYME